MISYVKGELVETSFDHIVVETSGIGYNIMITGIDYSLLPAVGSELKIYTYFSVREDAMLLYGFMDCDSLELFKKLITVSGIGPKGAMAILSVLTPDDLRFAILSQDAKAISKAPGVGAKTAQRVILELKDKMNLEEAFEKKTANVAARVDSAGSVAKDDAVQALVALGYSATESLRAVSKIDMTDTMSVEQILSHALKHLNIF